MKQLTVLTVLATVFLFASCDGVTGSDNDVDFTSHNINYSILVRNHSSERLVAFKGDTRVDRIIGGIPAHSENHGLPYDPALFDKTEGFSMILVTEAQYNANKNSQANLSNLKNTPFTRVYVFYNKTGDNTFVYEVSGSIGGANTLTVVNNSNSINVELRVNGVAGETIGFAPAGILQTNFRLNDGNYNIFPVFRRYNQYRDVVETVYPKGGSGYAWFQSYSFENGITRNMILSDLLRGLTFSSGAAWIVVDNQSQSAGIQFAEGSMTYTTVSGMSNIMSGDPRTFQIDMHRVGTAFAEYRDFSSWQFGPPGFGVALSTDSTGTTPQGTVRIEQGKMYTITVIGDHNSAQGLIAYISNTTDIPIDDAYNGL